MPIEQIRSLLAQPPSRQLWSELLDALDLSKLQQEAVELDYVESHTREWPMELCKLGAEHIPWPFVEPPPLWRLARVVSLKDRRIKVPDLAAFLAGDHFDGVEGLDLSYNKLGVEGVEALVASGRLTQLKWLDLSCCTLGDAGLAALEPALGTSAVTSLHLRNNKFKSKAVAAFFRSPKLTSLVHLDFGKNSFGAAGAKAMAANPAVRQLRTLNLEGANVGDGGMRALCGSRVLRMLERLNLASSRLGEKTPEYLQGALFAPAIRYLNLSYNKEALVFDALSRGSFPRLAQLHLVSIEYSSRQLAALGAAPWTPALQVLEIGAPRQAGISRIASAHNFTGLSSLRFHGGVITVDQCRKLLDARGLRRLRDLRIMALQLGDLSGGGLSGIRGLHRLGKLSPAFGKDGDPADFQRDLAEADLAGVTQFEFPTFAADAAAAGLAANASIGELRTLVMMGYTDGSDAALATVAGSPHFTGLRLVEFAGANISDDGVEALAQSTNLSGVRWLRLHGRVLGLGAAQALAQSPHLGAIERLRLEGDEMGYDAWDALAAGQSATWRAFLLEQSVRGSTGDYNGALKGLQGYAAHRGLRGISKLTRLALIERILAA